MGEIISFLIEANLITAAFVIGAFAFIIAVIGNIKTVVELSPVPRVILGLFGILLMSLSLVIFIRPSDLPPQELPLTASPASKISQRVTQQPVEDVPPTLVPSPPGEDDFNDPSGVEGRQLIDNIDRFRVMANTPKNRTGIWVNKGDEIYIEYLDGLWTGERGKQPLHAGCGFYSDISHPSHIYPLDPRQGTGAALIGYIGNQPFLVGCKSFNSMATTSGELYLGMNDCQGCFWDNEGEIYVRISITRK